MSDEGARRPRPQSVNLLDQAMAARERRWAEEAARAAERAADAARRDAEARAVEEQRRALDVQRRKREAERQRLEAEAKRLLDDQERVIAAEEQKRQEDERHEQERRQLAEERQRVTEERQRVTEERQRVEEENRRLATESQRLSDEVAAERARLDVAARELQGNRAALEAEMARLAEERSRIHQAAAAEAEREAALREAEREIEAARQRLAAEEQARAEAERRAIDEIDRRLEERAALARTTTPPPGFSGPKRKARLRVAASVLIDHGGAVFGLPLINVSLTGALVATQTNDLTHIAVGTELRITLVSNEHASQQADLTARVVRHDEGSMAVDWSQDEHAAHRVGTLLDGLSAALDRQPSPEVRERELEEIDQRLEALGAETPIAPAMQPKRKARLRLSASVLLDHSGAAELLPLVNVSMTGGLILTQDTVLARLRVGALLLLTLVSDGEGERPVDLLARVVRHAGDTTAVDWSQDQTAAYDVARLLDALAQEHGQAG